MLQFCNTRHDDKLDAEKWYNTVVNK